MENIIIVLISVAFVIYNIYQNFQKEVQTAKSRKQNNHPQIPKPTTEAKRVPAKKEFSQEITQKKSEHYHSNELPIEVLAAQERRKKYNLESPKISNRIEEMEIEKNAIEFDLRKAIIQSAILERPYK